MPLRIVAFSGNTHRPSRTRALVDSLATEVGRLLAVPCKVYDLVDAGQGIAVPSRSALPLPAARIIEAIEEADALIVGTPVYKGSYSGLFKHVFDFVEPAALAGKPVLLAATGGGARHALVVEHALRPLFGFFTAHTVPTAVYAGDTDIVDGAVVDAGVRTRAAAAAAELGVLIDASRLSPAGLSSVTAR